MYLIENTIIKMSDLDKEILQLVYDCKKIRGLEKYPVFKEELENLENEIKTKEYRITVVGEFSSGKSTFLDAIIGNDILPHGVKETTATITYVKNVPAGDSCQDSVHVHFRDEKRQDVVFKLNDDCHQLVSFLTKDSKQYDVAHDISYMEIFVHFLDIEEPIVLVDTPGLNGMTPALRDITIQEIRRSQASICIFPIRGVGSSEVDMIKELMKNQNVFFFVLNHIDELKKEESETPLEKIDTFRKELCNYIFNGEQMPKYVFGISALKALAGRDKSYTKLYKDDVEELTLSQKELLWKDSGVPELLNTIRDYLKSGEKEKQFALNVLNRISRLIETVNDDDRSEIEVRLADEENIPERKILLKAKDEVRSGMDATRKKISTTLGGKIADFEKDIRSELRNDLETIYQKLYKQLDVLKDFGEVRAAISNHLFENQIIDFWHQETSRLEKRSNSSLSEIYYYVIDDLNGRMPKIQFKEHSSNEFNVKIQSDITDESINLDDRLEQLKKKKEELDQQISQTKNHESVDNLRHKCFAMESEIHQLQNRKLSEIRALGSRPKGQWREREIKTPKTTFIIGRIGRLWGKLTGNENCGYEITIERYYDDSEAQRYDGQLEEIRSSFDGKIASKERELDVYEKQIEKAQKNVALLNRLEALHRRIEEDLEDLKKERDEKERIAKSSLLKEFRQNLLKLLDNYLSSNGIFWSELSEGISEALRQSMMQIQNELQEIFDRKIQEYLKNIDILLEKVDNRIEHQENKKQIELAQQNIRLIETIKNHINKLNTSLQ